MENNHVNRSNSLHKSYNKDKVFQNQKEEFFKYLETHIATASMVSAQTGIPQKNLCRYKRMLQENGRLWEVKRTFCKETGFKAWYLTTNPDYVPFKLKQLNLF